MNLGAHIKTYNESRGPLIGSSVCHAPQVSLNFEQSGNATACCFNRQFILGTYPRQSVAEIWNGERIEALRKTLSENVLPSGCQLCRHQLEAANFSGLHAHYYDRPYAASLEEGGVLVPRLMEFELSNACNLECVMCNGFFSSSIRKNRELLEPKRSPYDDSFAEQLRPFMKDLRATKFLGGEPFLNPLYFKIWDIIADENPKMHVSITTNGNVMNTKVKEVVQKLQPGIVLSCESLNPDRYQSIRVNGNFDEFQKNLDYYLAQEHRIQKGLSLAVCPMQQNWMDLPDLLYFCNQRNLSIGFNTVVWPLKFSIKAMAKKEIQKIHSFLNEAGKAQVGTPENKIVRENYANYLGMVSQIEYWAQEASA